MGSQEYNYILLLNPCTANPGELLLSTPSPADHPAEDLGPQFLVPVDAVTHPLPQPGSEHQPNPQAKARQPVLSGPGREADDGVDPGGEGSIDVPGILFDHSRFRNHAPTSLMADYLPTYLSRIFQES
jgi:hypothetical protein